MQTDILQVQGINSKGYGTIPKLVMQDKRLTIQAKAIYGYFCSYAGTGKTAFPRMTKIIADLGIGKNTYYTHFNLLKEFGYIKAEQEKNKSGQFKRNIYTLMEALPIPQNRDTAEKQVKTHTEPIPCLRETAEPYTAGSTTNNNNNKNNSFNINTPVKSSPSAKPDRTDEDRTDDIAQQIELYTALIKDNISYSDLAVSRKYDIKLVDEFIAIILDVVMTEGKTVRIGGEDKPRALVTRQLLKLTYSDIELVIDQFKSVTDRISKKKQYILTMLYNSKLEGDSHYTNLVNNDMWQ